MGLEWYNCTVLRTLSWENVLLKSWDKLLNKPALLACNSGESTRKQLEKYALINDIPHPLSFISLIPEPTLKGF